MGTKEVTFRTLDIGGDKVLSYYSHGKEENPFLGMRSIRFSLRHKDIFSQQIRAILRAGIEEKTRIMFPMISSVDEFLEAKAVVLRCVRDLKRARIRCIEKPKIGMMIELPAVIQIIEELARETDFFSVGTNDFIQYMLAVDRTNEKVSDLYLPHHPAILRSLKKIVDAADKVGKDLSICGDMAHQKEYVPYLLGMGVRKLSVDSHFLPFIQACIPLIDVGKEGRKIKQILKVAKVSDLNRFFEGKY